MVVDRGNLASPGILAHGFPLCSCFQGGMIQLSFLPLNYYSVTVFNFLTSFCSCLFDYGVAEHGVLGKKGPSLGGPDSTLLSMSCFVLGSAS